MAAFLWLGKMGHGPEPAHAQGTCLPKAVSYNAECLTAGLTLTAEPVAVEFGLETFLSE